MKNTKKLSAQLEKIYIEQLKEILTNESISDNIENQMNYITDFEKEINYTLKQINQAEQEIQKFVSLTEKNYTKKIEEIETYDKILTEKSSPFDLNQELYQELANNLLKINEKSTVIHARMDKLLNDSIESIKKMKKQYEVHSEIDLNDLFKKVTKIKSELVNLKSVLDNKFKILKEKNKILEVNGEKVKKCEDDFVIAQDKISQASLLNQELYDQINKLNMATSTTKSSIALMKENFQQVGIKTIIKLEAHTDIREALFKRKLIKQLKEKILMEEEELNSEFNKQNIEIKKKDLYLK